MSHPAAPTIEAPATTVDVESRPQRSAALDNLKSLMIAGIIASHAIMGYATFGSWTYQDVREVSLSEPVELGYVILYFGAGGLFLMALFFLISGLLSHDSLERKGSRRFVVDRVWRLGLPFAIYTLVLWPLLEYALFGPFLHRGFWNSVLDSDPYLDNGPMWFVGVLLLFSLGLVAWRRWAPPPRERGGRLGWRTLAALSATIVVTTFLVRLVWPADSNQPLNVKLWGWPEYVALFALGVVAARRGWLRPVERRLARGCGVATIVAVAATAASVASADALGLTEQDFYGGLSIPALLASLSEGVVAVTGPIWVLAFAQRHLDRTGPLRRAAARSSYLAFMLQGPVLVALALLVRPVDLPGDVKALVVASLGVVASFGLAWPLVTRTRLGRFV